MSFAEDMLNLRHEIDSLHSARMGMVHRLRRFRTDLRKSMARNMADMHKAFNRECARARAARNAFTSGNREMVEEMVGAFNAERAAAHRHFFRGKRA